MSRTLESDFLQNFNFHARIDGADDEGWFKVDPGEVGVNGEAGFQSITIPEESFESAEYREGIYRYTKKQPGPPTFSDASFMRGVTRLDTSFYKWAIASRGGAEYRADVLIHQLHKSEMPSGIAEAFQPDAARTIKLHECFPIRVKTAGDLDATSGEISIAEIDTSVEWLEVLTPGP
jgi:phage tail-like protein